jgi:chaperone required for assembly of F1-ATPase
MKRFYRQAAAVPAAGVPLSGSPPGAAAPGWAVTLDGRLVKTPGKRDLILPTAALAAAVAAEWNAQEGEVRPAEMPLMRLAARTLDRDARGREAVVRQIAGYAGTDLLCYRAVRPPELVQRQNAVWQPLVDWATLRYDAPLVITAGVIPKDQPPASLRAFAAAVAGYDDFTLTALQAVTGACGSVIIGLALIDGHIDADAAFAAAQLEESFQIEAWGEDADAAARRRALAAEIAAAARFIALLRA